MIAYLDYAATTPLDPEVLAAMHPYLESAFANPSSLHRAGQQARRAVEEAREQVAAAIGAKPKEIVFTSGATEADNFALRAAAALRPGAIVTSTLEHAAVLQTAKQLEREGREVRYLTPNARGEITREALRDALQGEVALVALMLVNNETGAISDVAAFSRAAREAGALVFCDAVQGFGTLPIDVDALGVDLLALSGHKVYGPKGVGVLYVCEGLELPPLLVGGEQERGLRAGTLNVPAIVGMGKAAALARERWREDAEAIGALRDALEAKLLDVPGVRVNAALAPRGPKHLNVSVSSVDGEALLFTLDTLGVYVSAGSACAAGSLEPSHVLTAMGLSREEAKASVRFSLGRGVTLEAIAHAAEAFAVAVERCRR
jgi:cysteine desulfurase